MGSHYDCKFCGNFAGYPFCGKKCELEYNTLGRIEMVNKSDLEESYNRPNTTSVMDQEERETKAIITAIDEALLYDGYKAPTAPIAKPKDVLAVLVQILVSKNLLSLQDVKLALNIRKQED